MNEESLIGEVEEGLLWFITQVRAITRWLWAMVPGGQQKAK